MIDIFRSKEESEILFRGLLESAPDAAVIADKSGKIMLVNAQTEKLFGYAKDEMIGKEVELLIPNRFHHKHVEHRVNFFVEPKVRGMGIGMEMFGRKKNGEEVTVEISLSPLKTKDGVIVSAAIRDITERKQIEKNLRESNDRFLKIFDNNPVAMTISSLETSKYQNVNKNFLSLFGYLAEEVIGKTALELKLINLEDREKIISKVESSGLVQNTKIQVRKKNGEAFWCFVNFILIDIDNKKYTASSYQDITDRKKAEESAKLKDAFLANMSHEIRTPMNAIIGFSDMLFRGKLGEKELECVKLIRTAGENLLTIINDILDLSKMEAGMMEFEEHPFSIKELFNMLYQMMIEKAKEKGLELVFSCDDEVPDVLLGDSVRLTQIMINLLGNAIKFTNIGSVQVNAKVIKNEKSEHGKVTLEISVKDTMAMEERLKQSVLMMRLLRLRWIFLLSLWTFLSSLGTFLSSLWTFLSSLGRFLLSLGRFLSSLCFVWINLVRNLLWMEGFFYC